MGKLACLLHDLRGLTGTIGHKRTFQHLSIVITCLLPCYIGLYMLQYVTNTIKLTEHKCMFQH